MDESEVRMARVVLDVVFCSQLCKPPAEHDQFSEPASERNSSWSCAVTSWICHLHMIKPMRRLEH